MTNLAKLPERNLDVLRMVAVLLVLVSHILSFEHIRVLNLADNAIGRFGVWLFFFHTSTVLMSSLERGGESSGWVSRFYVRRALRIYPLAIATVLATVALSIPESPLRAVVAWTQSTVVANLTLTQNLWGANDVLGPLWSLPLEVQMYLMLPIGYLIARKGVRPALVLFLSACLVGWFFEPLSNHVPGVWRLGVFRYSPLFGLGILFYAWLRSGRSMWQFPESGFTRVAKTVCKYSYGIYLLHMAAMWLSFDVLRNAPTVIQWGSFPCFVALLSFSAYHLIEEPGIRFGQWLIRRPMTKSATAPAP